MIICILFYTTQGFLCIVEQYVHISMTMLLDNLKFVFNNRSMPCCLSYYVMQDNGSNSLFVGLCQFAQNENLPSFGRKHTFPPSVFCSTLATLGLNRWTLKLREEKGSFSGKVSFSYLKKIAIDLYKNFYGNSLLCNSHSDNAFRVSRYLRFVLEKYFQLLVCRDRRVDNHCNQLSSTDIIAMYSKLYIAIAYL